MTAPKFNPNIENLHDGKVYIKNLYDADAYRLFSMPYGALTDDEKAKAKAQSKVVAYCAQGPLRPTESKPAEPPKIEAGRNKTALRHKIADLRLKVQRGHYPAGAERAAALKELYSLENQL